MNFGRGFQPLLSRFRGRVGVRDLKTSSMKKSKIGPNDIVPHATDPHYLLYRSPYPPPRRIELIGGELMYAGMWAWIFFRFIQDYRMVLTVEYRMPTWADFSDSELGIPDITEEEIEAAL